MVHSAHIYPYCPFEAQRTVEMSCSPHRVATSTSDMHDYVVVVLTGAVNQYESKISHIRFSMGAD